MDNVNNKCWCMYCWRNNCQYLCRVGARTELLNVLIISTNYCSCRSSFLSLLYHLATMQNITRLTSSTNITKKIEPEGKIRYICVGGHKQAWTHVINAALVRASAKASAENKWPTISPSILYSVCMHTYKLKSETWRVNMQFNSNDNQQNTNPKIVPDPYTRGTRSEIPLKHQTCSLWSQCYAMYRPHVNCGLHTVWWHCIESQWTLSQDFLANSKWDKHLATY